MFCLISDLHIQSYNIPYSLDVILFMLNISHSLDGHQFYQQSLQVNLCGLLKCYDQLNEFRQAIPDNLVHEVHFRSTEMD